MCTQTCSSTQTGFGFPAPSFHPKTLTPEMSRQVEMLSHAFRSFTYQCNTVLSLLGSAETAESVDTCTSNLSLVGYFVSNLSYKKNVDAARAVDELSMEADRINSMIAATGLHLPQLDSSFSGQSIMIAENDEHHPFIDWFTSGSYSSMASMHTARELQKTSFQVESVRRHAQYLQNMLPSVPLMP